MASIKVKIIQKKGQAALVEWIADDGAHRATIPLATIIKGQVAQDELDYGIPYGEPWEELITISATPASIAAELRKCGIWTKDDLETRPTQALSAIQAAYGCGLADLLRAVRQRK